MLIYVVSKAGYSSKIYFIFYWTNKNKWNIVESKMVTGTIKLGAKELSRNPLPCDQLEGFFYGGGVPCRISVPSVSGWITQRKTRQVKILCTSVRQHLIFYDNPSQKRVAECTNIPHTGALPTVKGVGQRLRKGFQKEKRKPKPLLGSHPRGQGQTGCLHESLSSAAELRHSARNTRLVLIDNSIH